LFVVGSEMLVTEGFNMSSDDGTRAESPAVERSDLGPGRAEPETKSASQSAGKRWRLALVFSLSHVAAILAGVVLTLLFLRPSTPPGPKVITRDNYFKISYGMTIDDVSFLLRGATHRGGSSLNDGKENWTETGWREGEVGSPEILVKFSNGKVIEKRRSNWK
jgi:hypothetical protein